MVNGKHNVAPSPPITYAPEVQHFSIGSSWLFEGESRLDATSYKSDALRYLDLAKQWHLGTIPLSRAASRIFYPNRFKRIYSDSNNGMPFLSPSEVFQLRHIKRRFLKQDSCSDCEISENWILVSRSGTLGRLTLVTKHLSQFAVSDDLIRISPSSNVPIGFLYSFLASKYGQAILQQPAYGAAVDHLEPHQIENLPLVRLSAEIEKSAHKKIVRAYALRDEANTLLDEADNHLHDLLGVSPFTEDDIEYIGGSTPRAYSVSSVEVVNRLDATHHVPLARSAVHKLQQGRFPLEQLVNRVADVYLAPRFARVYVESDYGTPLLQGSHIPLMRFYDLKYISNTMTAAMERWIIKRGWVLVTCSGTIGRTAITTNKMDGWAASQHILRIMPRNKVTHPGFLAAFISTPFGQHQLQAKIYGGVVDELTAEDTKVIWIPDVPYNKQIDIGGQVVKAYELRDQANSLEDQAISEVESAIQ